MIGRKICFNGEIWIINPKLSLLRSLTNILAKGSNAVTVPIGYTKSFDL